MHTGGEYADGCSPHDPVRRPLQATCGRQLAPEAVITLSRLCESSHARRRAPFAGLENDGKPLATVGMVTVRLRSLGITL